MKYLSMMWTVVFCALFLVALAGAENTLGNDTSYSLGNDDGILTAYEVSNLYFPDLDLAVLSACESGLGNISTDGVYGLQRGFRIASARNLLISLWTISLSLARVRVRD